MPNENSEHLPINALKFSLIFRKSIFSNVLELIFHAFTYDFEIVRFEVWIWFFLRPTPTFPKCVFFLTLFFFFLEKFTPHSLTQIQDPEKKNRAGKKKTPFSLTHSIFPQKWSKINFSGEIKKYGTFGCTRLRHRTCKTSGSSKNASIKNRYKFKNFKNKDISPQRYRIFFSLEKFIFDHFSAKIEWVSENGVFFPALFFFPPSENEWVSEV